LEMDNLDVMKDKMKVTVSVDHNITHIHTHFKGYEGLLNPETEQQFDSSFWIGRNTMMPNTAGRNQMTGVYAWCINELQKHSFLLKLSDDYNIATMKNNILHALKIQSQIVESQRALGDSTADADLKSQAATTYISHILLFSNLAVGSNKNFKMQRPF
ncbi:hypothetical protein Tco_1025772, partial [Tanacetum coccineum]